MHMPQNLIMKKEFLKTIHEFSSHNDVNLQDRVVMHDAQSTLRLKATKYYTTTVDLKIFVVKIFSWFAQTTKSGWVTLPH